MKRFILIAVSIMLGCVTTWAQTEITTYQPGITSDGITYFLPNTCVRVVVTTTKTHYTPGEFAEYAARYLKLNNVPLTAYDEWKIDDIQLYSYGIADNKKAYSIKFKQKTSAPLVSLANDGRLLAINAKVEDNSMQNIPTASVTPGKLNTLNGADFKTEEILSAGSKAKMAELTANEIYDIRENRGLLTKGQADFMPKDGEQLKLMLNNLNTQEEGLLQLFRGTTSTETHVFTFDVTPTGELAQQPLFNFSRYLGMVDADDPAGNTYYISVRNLKSLPQTTQPTDTKAKKEVEDLRYTIPGRAEVKISTASDASCASRTFSMAQFGRTEHLGGELFNKKFSTRIQLSPITGGIVKIEAEKPEWGGGNPQERLTL